MHGIAAFNVPGSQQSYFFKDGKYVKINWTEGSNDQSIAYGPTEFANHWASLKAAGFPHIDAILPLPDREGDTTKRAYVFYGQTYVRIEYKPGDQIAGQGVADIQRNWASLKQAGFDYVDAALIVPGTTDEAYVFSREQYCRIKFHEGHYDNDVLLEGPKPIQVYSSPTLILQVKSVDAILPYHGASDKGYIFSGDQYFSYKIVGGTFELLGGPHYVTSGWKCLHQAGFY